MVLQDMSTRRIMQTFMQTNAPTVPTIPFYNTAEDIQKTIGFRTGMHTCLLLVSCALERRPVYGSRHTAGPYWLLAPDSP